MRRRNFLAAAIGIVVAPLQRIVAMASPRHKPVCASFLTGWDDNPGANITATIAALKRQMQEDCGYSPVQFYIPKKYAHLITDEYRKKIGAEIKLL